MSAKHQDNGHAAVEVPDVPASTPPTVASHVAGDLTAESLQANMSAVASAHTEDFEAIGSAVGFASVGRDATITASATPVVYAKGNVNVRQGYTSAVLAGRDMDVSQAFAPIIIGKQLSVKQGGAIVAVAGEVEVSNGFVGVLLSPKATVSGDSRVLVSTTGALIIAAAILGGFGLVAAVMAQNMRRATNWRRAIHVPSMPDLSAMASRMPDLSAMASRMPDLSAMANRIRHHNAA